MYHSMLVIVTYILILYLWARQTLKKSANVSIKVVHMNELLFSLTYITYEWAQLARLERPARNKHSNLLGPFIGFQDN
jgi:hypothetical protein